MTNATLEAIKENMTPHIDWNNDDRPKTLFDIFQEIEGDYLEVCSCLFE